MRFFSLVRVSFSGEPTNPFSKSNVHPVLRHFYVENLENCSPRVKTIALVKQKFTMNLECIRLKMIGLTNLIPVFTPPFYISSL